MSFIGQIAGILIAAGGGGVISVVLFGSLMSDVPGILLALPGFAAAFILVKYVLWPIEAIRPVVGWLYPYDSWHGTSDSN